MRDAERMDATGGTVSATNSALGAIVSILAPPTDMAEVSALVSLFKQIATEEGWQSGEELSAHVSRSIYFALRATGSDDGPARLAGGMQVVRSEAKGEALPNVKVWPELRDAVSTDACAHVTILALAREWRGVQTGGKDAAAAVWLLCAALWRHCIETGVRELWLEATPIMLRCYRLWGLPLVVRGELRAHWGEPCYPCSLSVRETAGALAEKATRSRRYRDILATALGISGDTVTKVSMPARDPG